jgi:hypothetical protein
LVPPNYLGWYSLKYLSLVVFNWRYKEGPQYFGDSTFWIFIQNKFVKEDGSLIFLLRKRVFPH